jgi:hypothetical protein
LVAVEVDESRWLEITQGVGELEVYKLTQKSGVYSVRAINKHHYREGRIFFARLSLVSGVMRIRFV